jgi:hypothetical protein
LAVIPTVGMTACLEPWLKTVLLYAVNMATSAANVRAASNLSGGGSVPRRPTYSDVTKGATLGMRGAPPPAARIVLAGVEGQPSEAEAGAGLGGVGKVGSASTKLPDEQPMPGKGGSGASKVADIPPEDGEDVTGAGKEDEVPSGPPDVLPDGGKGEGGSGKPGAPPPKQTDEQPDEQPDEQTEIAEAEVGMRDEVVVIGFPDKLAITREPLVSVVNPDGFSMVSKKELEMHFLPQGWKGTIVLQLERSVGDYVRMSPGWDAEGTDYLWSLAPGEYKMEARAEVRATKAGTRGGGSGRGAPRMACSNVPSVSVARSVRTGYLSATTSFASGFGGKKFASKKPALSKDGGRTKKENEGEQKGERSGINIGSSSERRSKQVDWGRGWSRSVGERGDEEVSSKIDEGEESGRREVGKEVENSPLDEWARGVMRGVREKEIKGKKKIEKEVVDKMEEAWAREKEGEEKKKGEVEEEKEQEEKKREGGRGNVTDAVLLSKRILATNRLKVLLNRAKCERVEALDGPVDGDRVLLMSTENYASRGVRDGRYWWKGQTTSMKTENGAAVRSWRCGGGRICENENCGFKKRFGEKNVSGIEIRGNQRWVCFFCNEEVKDPEVECQAVKWTIRNEEEVAYCHMGIHNHDLGKLESRIEKEAYQMQVGL